MMDNGSKTPLNRSAKRISGVFSAPTGNPSSTGKQKECMQLNFLLLMTFLKKVKANRLDSRNVKATQFSQEIDSSLKEVTENAYSICSKQDLHIFPYKQFFLRNELSMKRISEWKLSKFFKEKSHISDCVLKMKNTSPDVFRRHLITLLEEKEEGQTPPDTSESWKLWKKRSDGGPFTVNPP